MRSPPPLAPPVTGEGDRLPRDALDDRPLALSVKELGSSIAWRREPARALVGVPSGEGELAFGGGGAGAEDGGGGGGAGGAAAGERAWLAALTAA